MRAKHHRLVAARRQIQYGEAAVTQSDSRLAPYPVAVRPAMPQTLRHDIDRLDVGSRTDDSGNPAHRGSLTRPGLRCSASHRSAVRLGCSLELCTWPHPPINACWNYWKSGSRALSCTFGTHHSTMIAIRRFSPGPSINARA